jgi:hypothetical protein
MQLSNTVQSFIEDFESNFSSYLILYSDEEKKEGYLYTAFHEIRPATNGKFSDWDTYCKINLGKVSLTELVEIDKFIKAFPGFEYAKNFNSPKDHYMAFMPSESYSPFIDIHIMNVSEDLLLELREKVCTKDELQKGSADWSTITHWRKKLNGGIYKPERLGDLERIRNDYPKIADFLVEETR